MPLGLKGDAMDLVLDFRRTPGAEGAAALEVTQQLLACFQTALGHELPNQLVVIQGFARMLTEGAAQTDEGRALLGRLADVARQVDETVRRLADLGRLCREVERGPLTGAGVLLDEVAREAIAEVNLMCNGPGVEYHVQEGLPLLPVSRRPLHQVLVQLLRNAAQSRLAEQEPLRIEVGGAGSAFWVRDNGPGITGVAAGQLFEPFAGHAGRGTGLGLFLVRSVVARWGGAIHLRSEAGTGTTVTITIPQAPGEPGAD
jgi:signal transduction histidine kinase